MPAGIKLVSQLGAHMAIGSGDLLFNKLSGILLLVVGLVMTATGFGSGSNGLGILGILFLAGGGLLLALKIIRRNRNNGF